MPSFVYRPLPPSLLPPRDTLSASAPRPRWQAPLPLLPIWKPISASFSTSVAVMTTAPAPSPKRTQVFRSDQSTQRDRQSAPTTTAFLYTPARTYCAAVVRAKTKPEQAAVRSNATALSAPIIVATCGPVPNKSSGVEVAWSRRSTSSGDISAASRALVAALAERDASVSSGPRTCRLLMPVRCEIHSSLVSTICARSSLETTVSGAAEPVPTTEIPKGKACSRHRRRRDRPATAPQRPDSPARGAPKPLDQGAALFAAREAWRGTWFELLRGPCKVGRSTSASKASRLVSPGMSTIGQV
mmetsp:Transcript_55224/g.103528  ORF Transcript_55224/g.103528 Transcript_55224/m.103528 type:complete len:300 (+) Transcript_55224:383-1282(+)